MPAVQRNLSIYLCDSGIFTCPLRRNEQVTTHMNDSEFSINTNNWIKKLWNHWKGAIYIIYIYKVHLIPKYNMLSSALNMNS